MDTFNPELLHALWLVAVPVGAYAYKEIKKEISSLQHKQGKHSKKLAKHTENLDGLAKTLDEGKEGVSKLNDKLDVALTSKKS